MALRMFSVIAEGKSDDRAFSLAQQNPLLAGRTRYELLDGSTLFPSDKHALSRAEFIFGFQPQESQVTIAGADTNTVWGLRILSETGVKRLLFFGLMRV